MKEHGEPGGLGLPRRDPDLRLRRLTEQAGQDLGLSRDGPVRKALVRGELADQRRDQSGVARTRRPERDAQERTCAVTAASSFVTLCLASPKSISVLSR